MKILFSDFDGTLVDVHTPLSSLNNERIEALQKAGNLFVICTGRTIFEMNWTFEHTPIPYDYLVLNNGGHILDALHQTLYEKTISHQTGLAIISMFVDEPDTWIYFCDGQKNYAYLNGQTYDHALGDRPLDEDFMEAVKKSGDFQIISLFQDDQSYEKTDQAAQSITALYGDEVDCHRNQFYLDIVPKGIDKGEGVCRLLEILHLDDAAVYTIGDSYNDLSMIRAGDVGCCFTYSPEEIQKESDRVVDYVYELIDEILGG
ncbi:MAG: HAD-IIB family hydrolase [bacterium]